MDFGTSLGVTLGHFGIMFAYFFFMSILNGFYMDFGMDFEMIFNDFLVIFLAVSATLQNHVFLAQFHRFTWFWTSEKHIFSLFSMTFSVSVFCIDFLCILASILARLWINFLGILSCVFFGH